MYLTFFLKLANVYRKGLRAELIGRMKTATQAYTSPDITWPLIASNPAKINKGKTGIYSDTLIALLLLAHGHKRS